VEKSKMIQGGIVVDDRGSVSFVNDFSFAGIKRFYMIENHRQGFVRAWHAHKKETKYVMVIKGAALVGAVKIDNWEKPSEVTQVERFILSEKKPSILYIPAGYANGFMSLTVDTKLIFFSTLSLEESQSDDFRFSSRHWDIWQVEER